MKIYTLVPILIFFLFILSACKQDLKPTDTSWPEITSQSRPWTRWWWQGSAVTKEGITSELEALLNKGFGGVEITPIYGVSGYEEQFIDFLSDEWVEMLLWTLEEAERLGLGVDMATGTGWPFGGPWVSEEDACKYFTYNSFEVEGGQSLLKQVKYVQKPFVRAVGNQIYEMHGIYKIESQANLGTIKEPLLHDQGRLITIEQLIEPVAANKNLQRLALDQVRFEKELPIVAIVAYSDSGEMVDLTQNLTDKNELLWEVPTGNWTIYEVFHGWHGKMVERAAPGGEGNVIDHFSKVALANYLSKFDSAFQAKDLHYLRAFFNDSYEVDDARGTADWTPGLFEEFQKRRGYDLNGHLPALFGKSQPEHNERILCDYRETISELIHDNFTKAWKEWTHKNGAIIRNQAHGSPANVLDLYAEVDIPEMEGKEPLRIKMASSAANVTGKLLTSSESATWLDEHFQSNLADIKKSLDLFMLNGVNHIFYHGTAYSPDEEEWPGWLFYAAIHANDRNPLWSDFGTLNEYVARCQSFLQQGQPDNDVLLYFPIYDRFSTPGNEMIEHFDGVDRQFEGTSFKKAAELMLEKGFTFDYISDQQIRNLTVENKVIKSTGNAYQSMVIPSSNYIPFETFMGILELASEGANVIFLDGLPKNISGYFEYEKKEMEFRAIIDGLSWEQRDGTQWLRYEKGQLFNGNNLEELLELIEIRKETMVESGLGFIRKKLKDNALYFINNTSDKRVETWVSLERPFKDVIIYDPMNGAYGKGTVKIQDEKPTIFLQLDPQQTLILKTFDREVESKPFPWYITDNSQELIGIWKIDFLNGGPGKPLSVDTDSLYSWTDFPGEWYASYSGTVRYSMEFKTPVKITGKMMLDLGIVKESTRVILNGTELETLIGPVYHLIFDSSVLSQENNVLTVEVSNKMANRIAHLDQQGIFWKKFYNINFPARLQENRGQNGLFIAENWEPQSSGLIGPVKIITLNEIKEE